MPKGKKASSLLQETEPPDSKRLQLLKQDQKVHGGTMLRGSSFMLDDSTTSSTSAASSFTAMKNKTTVSKGGKKKGGGASNVALLADNLEDLIVPTVDSSRANSELREALASGGDDDHNNDSGKKPSGKKSVAARFGASRGGAGAGASLTGSLTREPTMLKEGSRLIGSPVPGKLYTFVLDLDETIVYARDGPLYARAHLKQMLLEMDQCGEIIIWTAGDRDYAKAVLRQINIGDVIQHLVYRHKTWFNAEDYTKDLTKLGRNMDYIMIIENTPDCLRMNPAHGIIVDDFEGGDERDSTLKNLMKLIKELHTSQLPVPLFLKQCPMLKTQKVEQSGHEIEIYFLSPKRYRQTPGTPTTPAIGKTTAAAASTTSSTSTGKVVKVNRDKAPAASTKAATTPSTAVTKKESATTTTAASSSSSPTAALGVGKKRSKRGGEETAEVKADSARQKKPRKGKQ